MKIGSFKRSLMRLFGVAATSVSPDLKSAASDPPKAPATSIGEPNVTPWAEWQHHIDNHYARPGWTFCKFGVRGAEKGSSGKVFGIVRDGFGAYWCRFYVANHFSGQQGENYLAVTINARTGYAFGIFATMVEACEAVEIALRLSRRGELDQDPDADNARGAYRLLSQAIEAAGYFRGAIICRPMKDAVVVPGAPIPVWMRHEAQIPAEVKPS